MKSVDFEDIERRRRSYKPKERSRMEDFQQNSIKNGTIADRFLSRSTEERSESHPRCTSANSRSSRYQPPAIHMQKPAHI
jgi:hypothetical protein